MERLTEWRKGKALLIANSVNYISVAMERLAAIEDILGTTYDLSRLKELVEADRKGWVGIGHPDPVGEKGERGISIEDEKWFRELVLAGREGRVIPVKVGERFFTTVTGEVMEVTVKRIIMDGEAIRMELTNFLTSVSYSPDIFSRWLFKTREAAEKALEGV